MSVPPRITVKVDVDKNGVYGATLPEYDVFTEANDPLELEENINDLIFSFFDIPKELRKKIRFIRQPKLKNQYKPSDSVIFESFVRPGTNIPYNWA